MFTRLACWLSRDDNAFRVVLYATTPPLVAIVVIGFF